MSYLLKDLIYDDLIYRIEMYNPIWNRRNNKNSGAWVSIHRELQLIWNYCNVVSEIRIINAQNRLFELADALR